MAQDTPKTDGLSKADSVAKTDGVDGGAAKASLTPAEGIQTLRSRTVARGTIWQETYIRDFPPRHTAADREGMSLAADDLASNPMEDLLAALGACLTRSLHANALAQDIPIRQIELTAVADMHRVNRWGSVGAPKPIGFETIEVSVQIDSDAPRDVLTDLVRATALWSPVASTLFNPVHLDIRLADSKKGSSDDDSDGRGPST